MLYDDEDDEEKDPKTKSYHGEDNTIGQGNVPFSKVFLDEGDEEEIEGTPPFRFIYQPKYTSKPGALIEALKGPHLKAHFSQILFSLLTLLVFLPFYIALPYLMNNAHTKAETYIPQY